MRILFLTEFFDPEPMHRGLSFAKKLVAAGHEVEVITAFPNYPGGKIYPGYKLSFIKKEKIDGVQITRLPLYPSHDHSLFKRFVTYATFAFSALFYGLFFAKKPDVMYVFHPPLSTGLCAALIKKCRKIPFVLDIQDLWPDSLFAHV